jgi:hypothetical protein
LSKFFAFFEMQNKTLVRDGENACYYDICLPTFT